MKVIYR